MSEVKERIAKALEAVTALGVPREKTMQALKKLYKVYDINWEFIEAENYRALIDAIFEDKEPEGIKIKIEENGQSSIVNGAASKKPYLAPEEATVSHKANRNNHTEVSLPMSPAFKDGLCVINLEDESAGSGSCSEKKKDRIFSGNVNSDLGCHHCSLDVASSKAGDVKLSLMYDKSTGQSKKFSPDIESMLQNVEGKFLGSLSNMGHVVSLPNLLEEICESFSKLRKVSTDGRKESQTLRSGRNDGNGRDPPNHFIDDISKGKEKVKISLVDESGKGDVPRFFYTPQNIVYQNAHVSVSLARISDEDSCPACLGDCLSSSVPCACARDTSGDFAYTSDGLLKEDFLNSCTSLKKDPQKDNRVYCQDCPHERVKNDMMPEPCKGHLLRKFVKECWSKCGCDMQCGNRVVQRGIVRSLQVFWTPSGKGWGLRCTEDLPKGAFVCEYVGEILTNMELYERNLQNGNKRHTYPVCLDADWDSESILRDEEALCLDATVHGNVARFINHRCHDANLVDIPVAVETLDRHYYHVAFFTSKKVKAYEEMTWDYEIDFNDKTHPIEAFECRCESSLCRGKSRKSKGKRKAPS